jgi:hypothetical protein
MMYASLQIQRPLGTHGDGRGSFGCICTFQHTLHSSRVGRADEGASSNRPDLVTLAECPDIHEDHLSLLYLTDNEATLQAIHKRIGFGAKLNLSKSPDVDVLKRTIIKLHLRVQVGEATLLIKVKGHRGDPLNEETDIRAEMGRYKEQKEVIWDNPTNWTVY